MNKIEKISTLVEGVPQSLVLLVVGVIGKRSSKTGNCYVSVSLFDGDKEIVVNFFDYTVDSLREQGIEEGAILRITLTKKGGYYNQSNWSVCDDPAITRSDFVHCAPIDPDRTFSWLWNKVVSVNSNPEGAGPYNSITQLTLELLDKYQDAFKRSSAAVSMHHCYQAGLLFHSARMVAMAERACEVYGYLNKELLICATVLHDIGKVMCYDTDDIGNATYTKAGRFFDHAVVGIKMIHDASKEGHYDPEMIDMLEHMIASHHGKLEWGSVTTPAFPEAEVLHVIDLMDSRINMFEEAYKDQEPGTLSKDKVFGLENSTIYKPVYYGLKRSIKEG